MKLKYYMRGLGVGIIITTLILSLKSKELSDQEIINKALQLGMVMKEDPNGNLDEVYAKISDEGKNKDFSESLPEDTMGEQSEETDEYPVNSEDDPVNSEDDPVSSEDDPGEDSDEAKDSGKRKDEDTDSDTGNGDEQKEENQQIDLSTDEIMGEVSLIKFTIKEGMATETVSTMLQDAGLIEDAKDFTNYVKSQGKTRSLRKGDFAINSNTSYDDILKIITKNQ